MIDEILTRLSDLIEDWRASPEVARIGADLQSKLLSGDEPFLGQPLPEALVGDRLPPEIASAWLFVLRPRHRNPAHYHPNSTQHTAVIAGAGICILDGKPHPLELFDRARPADTLLVIAANRSHAFEPGDDPLVVLSFHTAPPDQLIEIEVDSARQRTYQ